MDKELLEKAKRVKLLLMDCDGVLTDGRLYFNENGEAMKAFHVRDGQGIVNWHKAGFESGIITGRNSLIVERRAKELGIKYIRQGSKDKVADFNEIISEAGLTPQEVAYIGDDLPDIPLLKEVGFSVAVADASDEVFKNVFYVTKNRGGKGAVREICDIIRVSKYRN